MAKTELELQEVQPLSLSQKIDRTEVFPYVIKPQDIGELKPTALSVIRYFINECIKIIQVPGDARLDNLVYIPKDKQTAGLEVFGRAGGRRIEAALTLKNDTTDIRIAGMIPIKEDGFRGIPMSIIMTQLPRLPFGLGIRTVFNRQLHLVELTKTEIGPDGLLLHGCKKTT